MKPALRFFTLSFALLLAPVALRAQEPARISGTVTTDAGQAVPGATVFIEGMGIGTATNSEGRYTFDVPAARASGQTVTITARRIGYRAVSRQVPLRGSITQDFALSANPLNLGDVVVTGAGTVTSVEKLGNVRNSVDSVTIQKSNETNIVNALAAKAPNVNVTSQSGEPGASSYIQIRGNRSIQTTGQPLFVVDGVPIDNRTIATLDTTGGTVASNRASDINPNDIESVEILKGAAAAAIYGASAGQGVVLINTKSGRPGPTKYSLKSTFSTDEVTHAVPLQTIYGQGFGQETDYLPGTTSCGEPGCRAGSTSWGPKLAASTPVYDHFGELFRKGMTSDVTLSASGGNERTLFYLSGTRTDQRGIMKGPNNEYARTSGRLKASHRLTDRFNVGGSLSYVDDRGEFIQRGSNTSGLLLGALRTPPEFNNAEYLDPEFGLHRSYRYPNPTSTSQSAPTGRGYDNPFFVLFRDTNTGKVGRTFGNVTADYTASDWLTLKETFGVDYYADGRLESLPLTSSSYPPGRVNRLDITNLILDNNLLATASKTFSKNLAGTLTLGNNVNSVHFNQLFAQGSDLIAPAPLQLNNTIPTNLVNTEYESLVHTQSYFGQATLDLFNQVFLTAGLRNDGSSAFGASEKRHWFPKASIAWNFTEAMNLGSAVPSGKLRLAYGETGQQPPVYSTISGLVTGSFVDGWLTSGLATSQGGLGGLTTSFIRAQPNLGPERSKELEGGVDLALFKNYADLSVTLYNSRTEGVILLTPLAPSTGFTQQASNAARIRNTGTEITLNLRPFTRPTAAWDIGVQWGKNNNKVLDLAGSEYIDVAAGSFQGASGAAWEGSRVGVLRGFDFARCGRGLVIDEVNIDEACGANAPKNALYIGPDGYPIVDETNRIIGDPQPKWTGSLRSSLTVFRNLTVSGLLDVRKGGQIWNGTKGALYFFGKAKDTENRYTDVTFGKDYMPAHPGASGVVAGPGAGQSVFLDEGWYTDLGSGFGQVSAQFVEDGGYAKLRELSIAYNLNSPWLTRLLGVQNIDLRLAGRNLHTWTNYSGIDPETNLAGGGVLVQGIDYFNNPQTRSFVFSIGLNR
ncbi:MAG TPA: SusC/RagA family TonB-linked outer membrane protein [Gemmatimonadaceae bacterium]|nr:SusC/RagA family TonB-linked outer membrane protein [Gemmatimonadaceae bacterium]